MPIGRKNLVGLMLLLCCIQALACGFIMADESAENPLISVTTKRTDGAKSVVVGRIHVEAQDGGLMLEDRSGRIFRLQSNQIVKREQLNEPFSFLSVSELAAGLRRIHGGSFDIHETDHYVLCSDASEVYTEYCGRLLESVMSRYNDFFAESDVKLAAPVAKLQVVIFRNPATFSEFARQQHPETDFSDVPGYYSIRDNQMLVTAVSGDRNFRRQSDLVRVLKTNRRQVETIVHEAVHQLAFNTGLQVRYAANPMWLSEGLAVYFEGTSGGGSLAWTRPGEVSRIHLPTLKKLGVRQPLPIPVADLLVSDSAFLAGDRAASAYAESWALVHYLITRRRAEFDRLLASYQNQQALTPIDPNQHLDRFQQATNSELKSVVGDFRRYVSRLRVPR